MNLELGKLISCEKDIPSNEFATVHALPLESGVFRTCRNVAAFFASLTIRNSNTLRLVKMKHIETNLLRTLPFRTLFIDMYRLR